MTMPKPTATPTDYERAYQTYLTDNPGDTAGAADAADKVARKGELGDSGSGGTNYKNMASALVRARITGWLTYKNQDVIDTALKMLDRQFANMAYTESAPGAANPADTTEAKALYESLAASAPIGPRIAPGPGPLDSLIGTAYTDTYEPAFGRAWDAQKAAFKAGLGAVSSYKAAALEQAVSDFDSQRDAAFQQFLNPQYGLNLSQQQQRLSPANFLSGASNAAIKDALTSTGVFSAGNIQKVQDAVQTNLLVEKRRETAVANGKADIDALTGRMRKELDKLPLGSDAYRQLDGTISAIETAGGRALESFAEPGGGFDNGFQAHEWVMQQANAIAKPYLPVGVPLGADLTDTAFVALQAAQAGADAKAQKDFLNQAQVDLSKLTSEEQAALKGLDPSALLKQAGGDPTLAKQALDITINNAKNGIKDAADKVADEKAASTAAAAGAKWLAAQQKNGLDLTKVDGATVHQIATGGAVDEAATLKLAHGLPGWETYFQHPNAVTLGDHTNAFGEAEAQRILRDPLHPEYATDPNAALAGLYADMQKPDSTKHSTLAEQSARQNQATADYQDRLKNDAFDQAAKVYTAEGTVAPWVKPTPVPSQAGGAVAPARQPAPAMAPKRGVVDNTRPTDEDPFKGTTG